MSVCGRPILRKVASGVCATLIAVCLARAEDAPVVERVWPVLPEDGAVSGPGTLFEIGYATLGEPHPRDLRFRIRLRPKKDGGESYTFDQRERGAGWLVGDQDRMLYRSPRPLADGEYRWDVAAWNGREWVEGAGLFDLRIDSVPPADVAGLTVVRDAASGHVTLAWDPVALDRDGRPEFVARYHVYRYGRGEALRRVRVHEIAVTEQTRYVDVEPDPGPLLLYRITAEDEAGNEGGPE